jgi:poly(A) polymerase
MVSMRKGLEGVAEERIRDELALIFSAPNSAATFRMLDEDNIVELLLPECEPLRDLRQNDFHHQDVWSHTLSALEALENFLANPEELLEDHVEEVQASFSQKLAGERTREIMLKLGVLIHDIGKPSCQTVDDDGVIHFYGHEIAGEQLAASLCSRLRFSNKEVDFVRQLVRQHMRAIHLFNLGDPSRRALSRFFRLGPPLFWPLILLFASDYMATLGPRSFGGDMELLRERINSWLDFYQQELEPGEGKPPLVNGHDIMKHLHLSPGPTLGKLLGALADLQWEGRINTRAEALEKAAQLLKEWG